MIECVDLISFEGFVILPLLSCKNRNIYKDQALFTLKMSKYRDGGLEGLIQNIYVGGNRESLRNDDLSYQGKEQILYSGLGRDYDLQSKEYEVGSNSLEEILLGDRGKNVGYIPDGRILREELCNYSGISSNIVSYGIGQELSRRYNDSREYSSLRSIVGLMGTSIAGLSQGYELRNYGMGKKNERMSGGNGIYLPEEYLRDQDSAELALEEKAPQRRGLAVLPQAVRDVVGDLLSEHYDEEVEVVEREEIEVGRNDNKVLTYKVAGETKKAFVKQFDFRTSMDRVMFQREIFLQKGLYDLGVSLAEPLAAMEVGDRGIIIQEYREGETVDKIAEHLTYDQKAVLLKSVVKELARFQAKATAYAPKIRKLVADLAMTDQNEELFNALLEKDHRRVTNNRPGNAPQHIAEAATIAAKGTRRYAGHFDFHPWNVMHSNQGYNGSQITLLDLETISIPSVGGTAGMFVGYDLATLLNWPEFEMGPIVQRDLVETFVEEFNSALREEIVVDAKVYETLKISDTVDFRERLLAAQLQTAYWNSGIEANEGRRGNPQRAGNAQRMMAMVNNYEAKLGYAPSENALVV